MLDPDSDNERARPCRKCLICCVGCLVNCFCCCLRLISNLYWVITSSLTIEHQKKSSTPLEPPWLSQPYINLNTSSDRLLSHHSRNLHMVYPNISRVILVGHPVKAEYSGMSSCFNVRTSTKIL